MRMTEILSVINYTTHYCATLFAIKISHVNMSFCDIKLNAALKKKLLFF